VSIWARHWAWYSVKPCRALLYNGQIRGILFVIYSSLFSKAWYFKIQRCFAIALIIMTLLFFCLLQNTAMTCTWDISCFPVSNLFLHFYISLTCFLWRTSAKSTTFRIESVCSKVAQCRSGFFSTSHFLQSPRDCLRLKEWPWGLGFPAGNTWSRCL